MPSAEITYDPLMRKTEAGGRLYSYWRRIKAQGISPEFVEFPGFYIWAIKNGYTLGNDDTVVKKKNISVPAVTVGKQVGSHCDERFRNVVSLSRQKAAYNRREFIYKQGLHSVPFEF